MYAAKVLGRWKAGGTQTVKAVCPTSNNMKAAVIGSAMGLVVGYKQKP